MSNSPSVVLKSRFIPSSQSKSNSSSFKMENFLEYMDRENTKKENNNYESYQSYMLDDRKSSGLFDSNKDNLTEKEKSEYKKAFRRSHENGSMMWQDVISFDNEWLKEIGVMNNGIIDENKLKNVTRIAMNNMLKEENMLDNSIWNGAIHYNTDNVHIHTAIVQTHDFRERGKRKPKTLEKMKSNVLNNLVDRSKENEKVNEFIRKTLIESKKDNPIYSIKNKISNREMVKQFNNIYKQLPSDKRQWKYNMNGMKDIRPEIDKLTDIYIERNFKKEFEEFKKQIDINVKSFKKSYGSNSKAEQYKDNVYKDMYTRMGNSILNELREYDKGLYKNKNFTRKKSFENKIKMKKEINNSLYKINRYMNDELQNFKNQREFESLQNEQEFER